MLSSYITILRSIDRDLPALLHLLNVIALLLVWLIVGNVCAEYFCISPELTTLRDAKCCYIPVFLARSLIFSTIIFLGVDNTFDTLLYCLLSLQFIYIIIVILYRPYKKALDNVSLIILEITTLYAFALPMSMRYV